MLSQSDSAAWSVVLQRLAQEPWVRDSERRWWPRFAFHYTDIRNAISILKDGRLLSRCQAEKEGKIAVSSGSAEVLAGTDFNVQDSVRLYFRPKTPTQYYAEGVHSQQTLAQSKFPDAHCPVPVFFLFDLPEILALPNSCFSDRTLAAHGGYKLLKSPQELQNLPWAEIYHNQRIDRSDSESAREIVAHRNAEIIVPRELDLTSLKYIYCRSEAEKDTLLFLLPLDLRHHYQNRIIASSRNELYFRLRTFIERVLLDSSHIYLQFSPETQAPGPFRLCIEVTAGQTFAQEIPHFSIPPHEYHLSLSRPLSRYQIRVTLDDHLVYANAFTDTSLPF
ncbi:MAG: DarT ssDNA thymidine ADP-ribosyltransferase family protein [Chloroflexota bacterium]